MTQVSYGTSSGQGLAQSTVPIPFGTVFVGDSSDPTGSAQPIVVNGLPALVPIISTAPVTDGSTNTQVVGTSAVPAPTPVVATSTFSLGGYFASVLASPGQHLIGVAVLLLVAWWFYKHVLKKF